MDCSTPGIPVHHQLLERPCCCSFTQSCPTLCDPMDCSTPGFSVLHLLEFAQIHARWISDANYFILCYPLLLLPLIFPSITIFSSESALCIRWPKYCNFSFSISLSNECSGLISFRIDWFDLFAGHGNLKSLLQHHSSKASVLWCSAFFTVKLSYYVKNHSFDYVDLCWQSDVSAF